MAAINAAGAADHGPPVRRRAPTHFDSVKTHLDAVNVPYRVEPGSRPGPRLLHPDRVRVLRGRPRGTAAGARRRWPLRRARCAPRRQADAGDRLRPRAGPGRARPGGAGPRESAASRQGARSRSWSGADPEDTDPACAWRRTCVPPRLRVRADLARRKLGRQLEAAGKDGAHFAVILGDELANGTSRSVTCSPGTQRLVRSTTSPASSSGPGGIHRHG